MSGKNKKTEKSRIMLGEEEPKKGKKWKENNSGKKKCSNKTETEKDRTANKDTRGKGSTQKGRRKDTYTRMEMQKQISYTEKKMNR